MTHHEMTTDLTDPHDPALPAEDERRFPAGHPIHERIRRWYSDTYSLWCLCDATKCRRAGRCTGDPERCLDAYVPLLSPAVLEGGRCHISAKCDELSFDEAMERWPDELQSLWRWKLVIESRRGAPRPRRDPAPGA